MSKNQTKKTGLYFFTFSAAAFFSSMALAAFSFIFDLKISLFAAVLGVCAVFYFLYKYFHQAGAKKRSAVLRKTSRKRSEHIFTAQVEEKLLALEQAGEFFGSSLKPADMFRLIGNRIAEIIPFTACFLFLVNESEDGVKNFKIAHVVNENPSRFQGLVFDVGDGLAGKALSENLTMTDAEFPFDGKLFPQHFKNSMASPLIHRNEKIGVLVLSSTEADAYGENEMVLLQAVTGRITALVGSSFNNQRNEATALTNMLTDLPNESAFYLILDQQIAEAQRFSQKSALTVLCMDIKDFSLVNEEHGHTTGDQLLTFAARIIKNQLRQMDFLAHPSADEFWAILPGATGDIVELVIERLDRAFSHSRFTLPSNTTIDIELHFGTAAFKKDGDTSSQLVQAALRRKTEEKDPIDPAMSPVIPFPLRNQQISENPF